MMNKCAKYKETWTVYEIGPHICRVMTYHVPKALCYTPGSTGSLFLYHNTYKTNRSTNTQILTHLHLHERSPVEAACCSRQGTPQTTPLRHGGNTPSSATFPQTFPPLCSFLFFLYLTSASASLPRLLSSSSSLPLPGCPI